MSSTNRFRVSAAILGFCAVITGCGAAPMYEGDGEFIGEVTQALSASDPYMFATFDGDGATEQKLFIFTSTDGSNWGQLSTGFAGPTGVLRDPSLIKNPNDGKWYIAYHTADAKNGGHFRRSVGVDRLEWDVGVSRARCGGVIPTGGAPVDARPGATIASPGRIGASNVRVRVRCWDYLGRSQGLLR